MFELVRRVSFMTDQFQSVFQNIIYTMKCSSMVVLDSARNIFNVSKYGMNTVARRYLSIFGVTPAATSTVWNNVDDEDDIRVSTPSHLLWSLYFLNHYYTDHNATFIWGVDLKRYHKWNWHFIEKCSILSFISFCINQMQFNFFKNKMLTLRLDITVRSPSRDTNFWWRGCFCGLHRLRDWRTTSF